jgi:hypothetical protein
LALSQIQQILAPLGMAALRMTAKYATVSGFSSVPNMGKFRKNRFALLVEFLGSSWPSCDICGKKPQAKPHQSRTTPRSGVEHGPRRCMSGATTKRMRVCTSCLRSGKVAKA